MYVCVCVCVWLHFLSWPPAAGLVSVDSSRCRYTGPVYTYGYTGMIYIDISMSICCYAYGSFLSFPLSPFAMAFTPTHTTRISYNSLHPTVQASGRMAIDRFRPSRNPKILYPGIYQTDGRLKVYCTHTHTHTHICTHMMLFLCPSPHTMYVTV